MSQYVGVGDDLKKGIMKGRKQAAQEIADLRRQLEQAPGGKSETGSSDMLVLGVAAAAVVGIVIWKKRKKG